MNRWLKTRRAWLLIVGAALCTLGKAVLSDGYLPAPVAVGFEGKVLWSTFLPLVWVAVVIDVLASKAQSVEVRAGRRLAFFDASLFALGCLVVASVFARGAENTQSPWGAAGNVLVLTGLAGWVTLHRGAGAGALSASALMVLTTMYGIRAPLGQYVRILQPDGDAAWTFTVGIAVCVAALLTIVRGSGTTRFRSAPDVLS